jgi:hypothetical protein
MTDTKKSPIPDVLESVREELAIHSDSLRESTVLPPHRDVFVRCYRRSIEQWAIAERSRSLTAEAKITALEAEKALAQQKYSDYRTEVVKEYARYEAKLTALEAQLEAARKPRTRTVERIELSPGAHEMHVIDEMECSDYRLEPGIPDPAVVELQAKLTALEAERDALQRQCELKAEFVFKANAAQAKIEQLTQALQEIFVLTGDCKQCGEMFASDSPHRRYCCAYCKNEASLARRALPEGRDK